MRIGDFYSCDICGRHLNGKDAVRNSCYIENGLGAGNYYQVCDRDAKEIIQTIENRKPKINEEEK